MVGKIELRNFMALRDVSLDLAPMTLLLGPNASGKSSVLRALDLLALGARVSPLDAFLAHGGPEVLYTRGQEGAVRVAAFIGSLEWRLDLMAARAERNGWKYLTQINEMPAGVMTPNEGAELPSQPALQAALACTGVVRLDPAQLAAESFSKAPYRITATGAGLPSALAELATTDPESFEGLQDALRAVVPGVKRVRLARTSRERRKRGGRIVTQWGHRLLLDTSSAERVPAPLVSEGTLLVLGLLTLVWTARARLVLLEDVERGLHPAALAELVKQLRMLQQRDPGLQFVMTSHSPYLVDAYAPEEVWLMALGDDGAARTARLTEHPDFERWRGMMNPGEFWSTVGEAWVKAKPAAVNAPEAQAPEAAKDRG